ncbi:MAG: efflux RND transporter permease subunit [Saprospiraceae bacterium]|nr:efflux RND transporter permease subunit [Saprospiraceae bacterium]
MTNQDIAVSLQTNLDGAVAGSYRDGDDNLKILMRNQNSLDLDVRALSGINILSQSTNAKVPVLQVANIKPDWGYAKLLHLDLFRTLTISCDAAEGITAPEITSQTRPWLSQHSDDWLPGYSYELGGESEESGDAMGAVAEQFPLAGFIILATSGAAI